MRPTVSIGIPAYNAAAFLGAAIDSALNQSFEDCEVFVCDNRSTDQTAELCSAIRHPRFRYRRFEDHVGQPGNWNRCIQESRGEFVVLLHADDLLAPTFVERAVSALRASPDAAFVHSSVRHIDATGAPLQTQQLFPSDRETPGRVFFQRLLLEGCLVNPAGVMVRRQSYAAVGPFFEDVSWATDWDMWMRLSCAGSVVSLAEPLASYREHSSSGTAAMVASGRNGRDEVRVIDHVLALNPDAVASRPDLRRKAVGHAAHRTWCWAEEACRAGYGAAARRGILEAVRMDPRMVLRGHVGALFLASFFGYGFFRRLQRAKRTVSG